MTPVLKNLGINVQFHLIAGPTVGLMSPYFWFAVFVALLITCGLLQTVKGVFIEPTQHSKKE